MKTILLALTLFFTAQTILAQEEDTIIYAHARPIEWSYFRGEPKADTLAAAIATTICLEVEKVSFWDGRVTFKSYAVMYPLQSWVKPLYKDDRTLQHEQGHFDIAAACAQALEAEINLKKIRWVKSPDIQATFTKWENKLNERQKQYDRETKGGNDSAAQKLWNSKILAELHRN